MEILWTHLHNCLHHDLNRTSNGTGQLTVRAEELTVKELVVLTVDKLTMIYMIMLHNLECFGGCRPMLALDVFP